MTDFKTTKKAMYCTPLDVRAQLDIFRQEIKDDDDWIEADVGELIPQNSYIRLGDDTLVELYTGAVSIMIGRSGISFFRRLHTS